MGKSVAPVPPGEALDLKKRIAALRPDERETFRHTLKRARRRGSWDPESWSRYQDAVLDFLPYTPARRPPSLAPARSRARASHRRRFSSGSSTSSSGDDDGEGGEDEPPAAAEPQSSARSSGATLFNPEISSPRQHEGIERLARLVGRGLASHARAQDRPSSADGRSESAMDARIRRAIEAGELPLNEIASQLGVHRTTVSRVVSRIRPEGRRS